MWRILAATADRGGRQATLKHLQASCQSMPSRQSQRGKSSLSRGQKDGPLTRAESTVDSSGTHFPSPCTPPTPEAHLSFPKTRVSRRRVHDATSSKTLTRRHKSPTRSFATTPSRLSSDSSSIHAASNPALSSSAAAAAAAGHHNLQAAALSALFCLDATSRGLVNICERRAQAAAAGSHELPWTGSLGGEMGSVFHFDVGAAAKTVQPRERGKNAEASVAAAGANSGSERQADIVRSLRNPITKPTSGQKPQGSPASGEEAQTAAMFGDLMAVLDPAMLSKVLFRTKPSTTHSEARIDPLLSVPDAAQARTDTQALAAEQSAADVAKLTAEQARELAEDERQAALLARMGESESETLLALMNSSINTVARAEEGSSEMLGGNPGVMVMPAEARQIDRCKKTELGGWLESLGASKSLADASASEAEAEVIIEDGLGRRGVGQVDEILARACSPEARARQRWMEREADQAARAAFQKEQAELWSMGMGTKGHVGKALIGRWLKPLEQKVREEQARLTEGKAQNAVQRATMEACKELAMVDPALLSFVTLYRTIDLLLVEQGKSVVWDSAGAGMRGVGGGLREKRSMLRWETETGRRAFVKTIVLANAIGRAVEMELNIMKAEAFVKQQTKSLNTKKKAQEKQKALAASTGSELITEGAVSPEVTGEDLERELSAAKHKRRKLRTLKALEEDDGVGAGKKQREKIKLLASIMAQQFEKWDQDKTAQVGALLIDLMVKAADVPQDILNRWKGLSSDSSSATYKSKYTSSTSDGSISSSSLSSSSIGSTSLASESPEPDPAQGFSLAAAAGDHIDQQHREHNVAVAGLEASSVDEIEGNEHGVQGFRVSSADVSAQDSLRVGQGEGITGGAGALAAVDTGSEEVQGGNEGLGLLESEDQKHQQEHQGEVVDGFRPAFVKDRYLCKTNQRWGVVSLDPELEDLLLYVGLSRVPEQPYMPMVALPRQWRRYNSGGYYYLPGSIMRVRGSKEQRNMLKDAEPQQLSKVFEALNVLGSTAWRMNNRVFAVMEELWEAGGGVAGLVDRNDIELPSVPDSHDPEVLAEWNMAVKKAKKTNSEWHSLRSDMMLKLEVARRFKDEPAFFYPHNLDFRGRAYPMHPHLHHLGSDNCRGLLQFASGRPLGPNGMDWLKVHLANVYAAGGVDKLPFDGRIDFVDRHMDDIEDSASNPVQGRRWWMEAEDPFQCLAACMELTQAVKSGLGKAYVSHLPVHQDGSCNGLQHYAALGRDTEGAQAVNLADLDRPGDVYSGIASIVKDVVTKDAATLRDQGVRIQASDDGSQVLVVDRDGVPFRKFKRAGGEDGSEPLLLEGKVNRKLVKQTVMTSVYGVTYIGARDQIMSRLKERKAFTDDDLLFRTSCYGARITRDAMEKMFYSARQIQNWLATCAQLIALENHAVQWTTPLGLPVVQPYRRAKRQIVRTSIQMLVVSEPDINGKVNCQRQKSAFPPNYVHSLDSTHMMMTAAACRKAGVEFAGVHDSFWTHAGCVDEMGKILRQEFFNLHSQPLLENLLAEFQQRYPSIVFPPVPARGDFDLSQVVKSTYFFN